MLNPETNPYRNIKPIWTVFDTTELDAYVILYKCLYVSHLFLLSYNILQAVCSKFKLYITMLMGLISVRIILHILSGRIKCAYGWNRFTFLNGCCITCVLLENIILHWFVTAQYQHYNRQDSKTSLSIPKGQSEPINQKRTDKVCWTE